MGQGALSKPVVQWWLSLNSSISEIGCTYLKKSTNWSPAYINETKTPTNFLSYKCPCPRGKIPCPGVLTGEPLPTITWWWCDPSNAINPAVKWRQVREKQRHRQVPGGALWVGPGAWPLNWICYQKRPGSPPRGTHASCSLAATTNSKTNHGARSAGRATDFPRFFLRQPRREERGRSVVLIRVVMMASSSSEEAEPALRRRVARVVTMTPSSEEAEPALRRRLALVEDL